VTKLNAGGSALVYSTYLGGSGYFDGFRTYLGDSAAGIAVDSTGNGYVTGSTYSSDFPTTPGAFQITRRGFLNGFVTKLNASGTGLAYSAYLGGGGGADQGNAIAVDGAGYAYITGCTISSDFPTTAGAFQTTNRGGENAFVTRVVGAGTDLVYSTYLGGSIVDCGNGIAVDAAGNAYVTGSTESTNFPTSSGAFQTILHSQYGTNAFVTKFSLGPVIRPATHFQLTPSVFSAVAGTPFALTVTAVNADNNTDTGYRGTIHFSSTDGAATLPANFTFTAADNGVQTFAGVVLRTAGNQILTATDAGVSSITGSAPPVTISPAATAHFLVAGFPSPINAGTPGSVTVTAKDAYGNTTPTYTGRIYFSSSDSKAVLPDAYTFLGTDNGTHTFPATLKTSGNQSITVTDLQFSNINGTQGNITVVPLAASSLHVSGPISITAGMGFSFTVTAWDPYGNVAPTYRGGVTFRSSDSQAELPSDYTFTASDNGSKSFSAVLKTAGSQALTATDKADGTITGTAAIYVWPADANTLQVAGFPNPATAGEPGQFTVTALDLYRNVASGYRGTVRFTSSDPQAALPANYSFDLFDGGVHTFTATLNTPGVQSITATDTAITSITGTQSGIVVNPGGATNLLVAGFPSPITAGVAGNVTVTARDASGHTVTGYRGTVHFTSSEAQAVLPSDYMFVAGDNGVHTFSATLKTAGSQSLTATDTDTSNITGTQSPIVVNPADAASLVVAGFPSPTNAGDLGVFSVTAHDPYGNVATGFRGTVHCTSSDAQAQLPANYTFMAGDNGVHYFAAILKTAGTQAITATDTVTSSITGTQAGIIVNPAGVDHLKVTTTAFNPDIAGTPFDVTVTAFDQYNNVATGYTGTVHFSSADPYGATLPADYNFQVSDQGTVTFPGGAILYTAGTWDVTATDTASGIAASAVVNVQAAPAVAFQLVAPSSVVSGTSFDITVVAVDPYGNTDINYAGTVTFSTSDGDPAVMLPPDYSFQGSDQGMVTFAGMTTLITLGDQSLMVTDTVSGITGAAVVTVTTGPVTSRQENRSAAVPASPQQTSASAVLDQGSDPAGSLVARMASPSVSLPETERMGLLDPGLVDLFWESWRLGNTTDCLPRN
jgi:hypothetical protein